MTNDEMYDAIVVQRRGLADVLNGLTDEEWNTSSLCAGWKVRDVVGHLVSILEIPTGRFVLNAVKARSFDRYADQIAREIGTRTPAELARTYRSFADKRFAPPVVGPIAPLADLLVHTRDIERPLARPVTLDADAQRTVLNYVCGGKARGFVSPKRTNGLRFEANDLGWSLGTGSSVSGPGEAIMMVATGRKAGLADLAGDGVGTLTRRLA
jgi:uncharacterized protein (TIGR03083 family)